MALEGLQAVQARISQIQAQLGTRPPAAVRPASGSAASFDTVLAAAVATATPAQVRAPGAYGPIQPPAELAAFGNGQIPLERLVPIGEDERLYAPAANAFNQMAADALRAGVRLEVNDGYRSFPQQQELAAELGLYRDGGKAAVPGTSTHGWGLSVDVDTDGGAATWLRANAARYGFVEDVPGEPWHWTYRPG